ncbi:MAG TPA: short-chain dehydrogenase/reductase, partial [Arthrobacter bacterium]|nr:short-chain dehydrogenase/reductase [Arthrobacter sp.]
NVTTVNDIAAAYPDTALALPLDVTNSAEIASAMQQARKRFGGIDVLVNNAGYGYRAAVEEADDADIRQLFDTNVFGAIDMIKAVLPGMRANRAGSILNISSIGARISPAGSGYYSASKAALEGLSGSLHKELRPLGINVTVIEPGAFRTDFAGRSLTQSARAIEDYAETAGKRRKENDTVHGTQPGDPAKAAEAILAVAENPNPPSLLVLGKDAFNAFAAVAQAQRTELDQWQDLSLSTGIEGDQP